MHSDFSLKNNMIAAQSGDPFVLFSLSYYCYKSEDWAPTLANPGCGHFKLINNLNRSRIPSEPCLVTCLEAHQSPDKLNNATRAKIRVNAYRAKNTLNTVRAKNLVPKRNIIAYRPMTKIQNQNVNISFSSRTAI